MRGNGGGPAVRRAPWALGLAAGGVLAGHGVTYAIVHPDAHERAGVLAATGHAYLHLVEGPGLIVTVASAFSAVLVGFGRLGPSRDRGSTFRRFAAIQIGAFAAIELGERVGSGAGIGGQADLRLLATGLSVQLVLAWAGAWLLDLLHRAGARLVDAHGSGSVPVPRTLLPHARIPEASLVPLATLPRPNGRAPPPPRR